MAETKLYKLKMVPRKNCPNQKYQTYISLLQTVSSKCLIACIYSEALLPSPMSGTMSKTNMLVVVRNMISHLMTKHWK